MKTMRVSHESRDGKRWKRKGFSHFKNSGPTQYAVLDGQMFFRYVLIEKSKKTKT